MGEAKRRGHTSLLRYVEANSTKELFMALYVKLIQGVSESLPLTKEQFDLIEPYLRECMNRSRRPKDSTCISMLADYGLPAKFPKKRAAAQKEHS